MSGPHDRDPAGTVGDPGPAHRRRAADEPPPTIADRFADLLAPLGPRARQALVARLARGYYEGWRPDRAEIAAIVEQERRRRG